MSLVKRTGALVVAVFLTLTLLAPQSARANVTTDASITSASSWIADAWENKRAQFFTAGTAADGVIALSAANREPNTVRSMLVDLKKRGPSFSADYPAGLAKMIVAADIAGQNPRTLFGCDRDLVAELQTMVEQRSATGREYWGPYLIAIALSRANEQVPDWVIEDMEENQDATSGGFGSRENDGSFIGDPDYTAVGISAMNLVSQNEKVSASRRSAAAQSVSDAIDWSSDSLNRRTDAAGNYYWSAYSPANSTGLLASALGEVGADIASPVRFLVSQQTLTNTGGWGAELNDTKPNVMATTQSILGVIGEGYGTARSTQVPEMVTCDITPPKPVETVYNTEGDRTFNGREWSTTCEPYSQTTRCRTLIKAKTVEQVNGRFVATTKYVFNNMTYLPSPRSLWATNPLGGNGKVKASITWTATNGRNWRTECDSATTGRNGCRTYITSRVIDNVAKPGQPVRYDWVTKEIFNNMVQFS